MTEPTEFSRLIESVIIKYDHENADIDKTYEGMAITISNVIRPQPTEAQIRAGGELFKELRSQFDRDPQQAAMLIYKAMIEAM